MITKQIGLEVIGTLEVPLETLEELNVENVFNRISKDKKYVGDLFDVDFKISHLNKEEGIISYGVKGYVWLDDDLYQPVHEKWFIEDINEWSKEVKKIANVDFGKIQHIIFQNIISA